MSNRKLRKALEKLIKDNANILREYFPEYKDRLKYDKRTYIEIRYLGSQFSVNIDVDGSDGSEFDEIPMNDEEEAKLVERISNI